ncbi:MAG: hypothetical protein ACK48U_04060, partial [Planctomyces sp.]
SRGRGEILCINALSETIGRFAGGQWSFGVSPRVAVSAARAFQPERSAGDSVGRAAWSQVPQVIWVP